MAGFEDYSAQLQYNSRGYCEFVACSNHSVIYDGALTALLGSFFGRRNVFQKKVAPKNDFFPACYYIICVDKLLLI